MNQFNPSQHPRGGNPANPGEFSPSVARASEISLEAPTGQTETQFAAFAARRKQLDAARTEIEAADAQLLRDAVPAIIREFLPQATSIQIVDDNWEEYYTGGGTLTRAVFLVKDRYGNKVALPKECRELTDGYLAPFESDATALDEQFGTSNNGCWPLV
ncbi:hypothetical protein [Agromyces humi]|uniref:hypothetical protein n=1 Tax=Agromyces humi TaxID=1766800 RepID=UPI001357BAB7|nr:hypothetical protein [Agromyces humi]